MGTNFGCEGTSLATTVAVLLGPWAPLVQTLFCCANTECCVKGNVTAQTVKHPPQSFLLKLISIWKTITIPVFSGLW